MIQLKIVENAWTELFTNILTWFQGPKQNRKSGDSDINTKLGIDQNYRIYLVI
jgi:hypothetical protein